MSEPIQPALTAGQWADINGPMFCYGIGGDAAGRHFVYFAGDTGEGIHISRTAHGNDPQDALFPVELPAEDRHALAALALYGQPFGFTREDVRMLHRTADYYDESGAVGNWHRDLADRIEALLPPEIPS